MSISNICQLANRQRLNDPNEQNDSARPQGGGGSSRSENFQAENSRASLLSEAPEHKPNMDRQLFVKELKDKMHFLSHRPSTSVEELLVLGRQFAHRLGHF